jgi:hypothetical protein
MINTSVGRDVTSTHQLYNRKELQHMYLHKIPAYVYCVTHIPTGKFYFGARYKHVENNLEPENDLWVHYFTSSKQIKQLRDLSLDTDFESKIIFKSLDTYECFCFEQKVIKENINDPLCLNMRYFDTDKSIRIFSTFGRTLSSKGRKKSESTKQKMRKPKSETHRKRISEAQFKNGGNGPSKHKEETKDKIRQSMKLQPRPNKKCPHCGKLGGFLSMSRWHFDNCRERK